MEPNMLTDKGEAEANSAPGAPAASTRHSAPCGVSTESRPRPIPPDRIPAALSNPPPSPSTTDRVGGAAFTVYLIDGERLRPVPRSALGGITPAARLEALRAGPTSDEAAAGLGSALNEETSIRISRVTGGTATVDLPHALAALVGSDQILALAQLVFTLTEGTTISEVIFTVDGEPVAAPVDNGALIGRPSAVVTSRRSAEVRAC